MPTLDYSGEVEFECVCQVCGNGLSSEVGRDRRGMWTIEVEACQGCIDAAIENEKETNHG
jgi:hypothetical protein